MKRILPLALLLSACGATPHATPLSAASLSALQGDTIGGGYLSLEFKPTQAIQRQADATLLGLGFVDVSHAVPPRDPAVYHATVSFFTEAPTAAQVALLTQRFKGKHEALQLTGWGVAKDQVAYFTVDGVEPARKYLRDHAIPGAMDDAHITFGVSPSNPRDVHGVPKTAQHRLTPLHVRGDYQLYLTTKGATTARWP